MLIRFLWAGLMAGLLAGVPTAAIQHFTTTPLILQAEHFEQAGHSQHAAIGGYAAPEGAKVILASVIPVHGAEAPAGGGAGEPWAPENGLERTFFTSITTIITTIGYAFMLLAAMFLAKDRITPRTGLLWGLAGFAATGLAPGLGLSPELPGAAAADVVLRQIWWAETVVATAGGLWLILKISSRPMIALGVVLIAAPHLIGAPHPDMMTSRVPAELAAQFAASSLVLHAIIWVLAGAAAGFLWQRQEAGSER